MTKNQFKGTGVAIVTPFKEDESIDYSAFAKVINYNIENKVEYIVALGTTGETPTVANNERQEIVDFCAETINKRVPLVVGVGGNCTREALNKIKETNLKNVDAILSVCPYYNKPNQRGVYEHYKAIASGTDKPVIMYNVPGRTGINMTAETTVKLAHDFKNLVAMKEASGNLCQIMDIIRNKPSDFLLISGDDMLTLPILAAGGDGIISVVANAFPKEFSEMVRLALQYKMPEAQKLHYKLFDIMNLIFADGSPAGVKAALHIKGLIKNIVRLPLVPVNDSVYKGLEKAISKI